MADNVKQIRVSPTLPPLTPTRAMGESVQAFLPPTSTPRLSAVFQIASQADEAPPWWSPERDAHLDKFWPTEPYLAGCIFSVASRNASYRYELTGHRRKVAWAQQLFAQADFGLGWSDFMMKLSQDYLVMGNGAWIEIIRPATAKMKGSGVHYYAIQDTHPETGEVAWFPYDEHAGKLRYDLKQGDDFTVGDNPLDLPRGLAHKDSLRIERTGDPQHPAIYTDLLGKQHLMSMHQIMSLEEMPSPREELNGVQHCLHRDSTVHMADGSTKRIIDLVQSRSTELVKTLGDNGNIIHRCICGWYENKRREFEWINIRGKYVKSVQGWPERNSWVTNDHLILTPSGWTEAGDLETGDKVVTACRAPNKWQKALIVGTMLGDASMTRATVTPRMNIGHHVSNSDWVDIKVNALADFLWRKRQYQQMIQAQTRCQPAFHDVHNAFYGTGRKVIPLDLVAECLQDDDIRPYFLAAWYLDDGHIRYRNPGSRNRNPSASIGCVAADPMQVKRVTELLSKVGYEASPVSTGIKKYKGSKNISFSVEGSRKLFEDIAPLVPPSMRYKLPHNSEPFDNFRWKAIDESIPFVDEVIIRRKRGGSYRQPATTYCIDVEETHNFITSNVVVHNCAVDRALILSQTLRDMLIYKHEKVSGRFMRAIHLTNMDADLIQDSIDQAMEYNDNKGLMRYSQPVIATVLDPNAQPKVETIELASLPDGFDEETAMRWYVAGLAMDFGVDFGFLAPLPGNKLGTSDQAEQAARQAKGKSSRLFLNLMEYKFNFSGILPRDVYFKFAVPDPYEESERDRALARRARSLSTLIQSGVITSEIGTQLLVDWGDLDPKYLSAMGLGDLTPIVTVGGADPVPPSLPAPAHFIPAVQSQMQQRIQAQNGEGGGE